MNWIGNFVRCPLAESRMRIWMYYIWAGILLNDSINNTWRDVFGHGDVEGVWGWVLYLSCMGLCTALAMAETAWVNNIRATQKEDSQ